MLRRAFRSFPTAATRADSSPYGVATPKGLIFPSNGAAASDTALVWSGSALLPRFAHTSLWKAKYTQQAGYYSFAWHAWDDNQWHSGTGKWEYGTNPYPTTGAIESGTGYSIGGTAADGLVHYHEIANGLDKISDGGSPLVVVKDVWLLQARKCETVGGNYVHTFWPDIESNPGFSITWVIATGEVTGTPTMMYCRGASPWTGNGNTNSETPSGTFRFFKDYSRGMSLSEIQAKFAIEADDTTDADRWYSNINPTPTDVTDKSGLGHSPSWKNANRPTLYVG